LLHFSGEKIKLASSTTDSTSPDEVQSNTGSEATDIYSNPQQRTSTVEDDNVVVRQAPVSFLTPRLALALDKAQVSDPHAVHILAATAEALGHNVSNLVLSRSTIHRFRIDA